MTDLQLDINQPDSLSFDEAMGVIVDPLHDDALAQLLRQAGGLASGEGSDEAAGPLSCRLRK